MRNVRINKLRIDTTNDLTKFDNTDLNLNEDQQDEQVQQETQSPE